MKCPKCGYLGFEHVERCRNCGYQFSLASPSPESDLNLREPSAALGSLPLRDLTLDADAGAPGEMPLDSDRTMRSAERGLTTRSGGELPLFPKNAPDVRTVLPPAPRPLAVRRATPEVRKARIEPRVEPRAPMLDLAPQSEAQKVPRVAPREPAPVARVERRQAAGDDAESATIGDRGVAASVDVTILALIDAVVIYFTLRICGLTIADLAVLPMLPLTGFLGMQNLAYLVAFTVGGGQTPGKMAMGIRVVSAADGGSLNLGRAMVRSAVWALLAIPAGLGFLTAWLADDQRGVHDRVAGTRVVRARPA